MNENASINEQILEIRYKPNPRILDLRGKWADLISSEMQLSQWQIIENRIDVFSPKKELQVFVGYRNAGMTAADTPTKNFFPDKAVKLMKFIFSLQEFGDPIKIERIGVRSRFCIPYDRTFEDLLNRYATRYLKLTDKAVDAVGRDAKLIDLGGPVNFADKYGNFNTSSGPMNLEQLTQFFGKREKLPEVGFYYDIDYWLRPNSEVSSKEVLSMIKTFATESWDRGGRIFELILGN